MARKKIRECTSKKLLKKYIKKLADIDLPLECVNVDDKTDLEALLKEEPWLAERQLVVKPDMLFGQRGKHDLVGLNLDWAATKEFIAARMGKVIEINGCAGPVTTFIVEPFAPHKEEYYLSFNSHRLGNDILFSDAGGVDIEENWDRVKSITLDALTECTSEVLAPLVGGLPLELRPKMEAFIRGCYTVFEDLDFSLMEMNPFTLTPDGEPFPLDMRGELDDTAFFKSGKKWGLVDFPLPFGRNLSKPEEYISGLDEVTGASLKLSILNPKGRIWTMVAGGGASVIYTDTVGDLGLAPELANYAEYSGAPNTAETYNYAKALIGCACANPDGQSRALIVGGGIANFTDVAATFKGIVMAMRELQEDMRKANLRVYVRRGGPNYAAGLQMMRDLGTEIKIPFEVYGPESSMTVICAKAVDYVQAH